MVTDHSEMPPVVVGVCGASGQIYARAVLQRLADTDHAVALIVSDHAPAIAHDELGPDGFGPDRDRVTRYRPDDLAAPPASGSYPTAGMIVCPCTLNTLAGVAAGLSNTLILRAAQVHLKQRRTLVLAVRDMPVGVIDLENMVRVARAGALATPISPAFYQHPETLDDLARHTAERLIEPITGEPPTFRYPGRP